MCNDIILKLWFALRLLGIIKMFMKGCLRLDGIGPRKSTDSVDFRAEFENKEGGDEDSVCHLSALV